MNRYVYPEPPVGTALQRWWHALLAERAPAAHLLPESGSEAFEHFWPELFRVAGDALVLPALHTAVEHLGIASELPEAVRSALAEVHQSSTRRNQALLAATTELAGTLNRLGVTPRPLKGMALLLAGVYPQPGARMLSDVDLLIEPAQAPTILRALSQQGYRQLRSIYRDPAQYHKQPLGPIELDDPRNDATRTTHHHLPVLASGDDHCPAFFELHLRVCGAHDARSQRLNELAHTLPMSVLGHAGAQLMQSPEAFLLAHALHHSAVNNDSQAQGRLDYRAWLDMDRLLQRLVRQGHDAAVHQVLDATGLHAEFGVFLWQSEAIFGVQRGLEWQPPPATQAAIKSAIARHCRALRHPALRRLRRTRTGTARALARLLQPGFLQETYPGSTRSTAVRRYLGYLARSLRTGSVHC